MVRDVIFNGPEGRIEAKFHLSEQPGAPIALVLHPHPLHGGTMNNKVVYNAFHTFMEMGFSVLRFNFRGVGKSHGEYDSGIGELTDAACALDWIQNQCPDAPSCWLAGFSFGSWIMLQLLMRRPEVNGFVAISPPAKSYDFNFLSPCPAPGIIIQGNKDTVVSEEDVYDLYEKVDKQRNSKVDYYPISGADHFFKDKLPELKEAIKDYVEPKLKEDALPKKVKRDRRRRQTNPQENASG
ncbi:UNVERIFIED_CONTAM: hypothetical protein GTU68_052340 [Idotea baltica]|nr:hypothetical protein [Idotea baltica]